MFEDLDGFIIPKLTHKFLEWKGELKPHSYGGKPIVDYNGTPLFAEIAILQDYLHQGYDGFWIDSFSKKLRKHSLVDEKSNYKLSNLLIEKLNKFKSNGIYGGTWDLIIWNESEILFIELKRKNKDRIQNSQIEFMKAAIAHDFTTENFRILEWEFTSEINAC
ncbi:MAG: hypothetical protein DWQ44_05345 [Bacteroidetes bacterium]|nr:MAG: hypothetical protein DWQ33_11995 [Bacteroidota bacterium]REK00798.1 MAG: hypothetical protein DWQ39_11665 [Bacteroidota bacterium]REK35046.1 MAG: hypothetical protein DWQ44_05345 [Bacteroidota bacterium]REK48155.1 MAG: hypothetical protein DWQ48_10000 [Bacteroidota bacterium]